MTFCYHQALKGYFYQCWKRIHISWMIDSNLLLHTQSPNAMRLSMLSLIFSTSQCPLNMTSGMAWTTKGIDCFNPTTINVMIPSSSTPTCSPDYYSADFRKYISYIIKIQSQEKEPFSWSVFNTFNMSTPPCWILFSNDKYGIGNLSKNNLYPWSDVYRKCKSYQITDAHGGLLCGL